METPDLTIRETAALSGVASTVVEKAVQSGIILPRAAPALFPGGSTRYLPARAVVYFHALKAADLTDLPRRHKRAIWSRITGMEPMRLGPVEFAPGATLDLKLALCQFGIANGYREARDRYIKSDPEILGGTPVIDGTRIPVYAVLGGSGTATPSKTCSTTIPMFPGTHSGPPRSTPPPIPYGGGPRDGPGTARTRRVAWRRRDRERWRVLPPASETCNLSVDIRRSQGI